MRGGFKVRHHEEEEESAFVSMTDMTVSFLFIVMLLLAYFASQYSERVTVPRTLYDEVRGQRDKAFDDIKDLEEQITKKINEISRLTNILLQRDRTIKTQNDKIVALNNTVRELTETIEKMKKVDPLEAYLAISALERKRILETLRDQLKIDFPDLKVVISEETDALRFQGDGLFATGSWSLRPDRKAIVESIAGKLAGILPCYTIGIRAHWEKTCNPGSAIIEALQIEGHTDSTGDVNDNLTLSTNRANSTFFTMTAKAPELVKFLNFKNQPVLSVAGYGKMRPVKDNATKEGRDTNRRVDLRIIMYTPSRSTEIDRIRQALRASLLEGGAN